MAESIFGLSPQEVQQQETEKTTSANFAQAQLDPLQSIRFDQAQSGSAFGKAIGDVGRNMGLDIGGESPQMQQAKQMQAIVRDVQKEGVDPTTDPLKFYQGVSKRLIDGGLTRQGLDMSLKASELAMKQAMDRANIGKLNAEAMKAARDKESAAAGLQREARQALAEGRNADADELNTAILKAITPDTKIILEGDPQNPDRRRNVLLDGQGNRIWEGKSFLERVQGDALSGASKLDGDARKDLWTTQMKELSTEVGNAKKSLGTITQMRDIMATGQVDTGFAAPLIATVKSALSQAGIIKESETLTNDQLLQKYANQLILPQLKDLKGSLSDRDLSFIQGGNPNSTQTRAAITKLLNAIEKQNGTSIAKWTSYTAGLDQGNEALTFDPIEGKWGSAASRIQQRDVSKPINTPEVKANVRNTTSPSGNVPLPEGVSADLFAKYKLKYPTDTDAQLASRFNAKRQLDLKKAEEAQQAAAQATANQGN